VTNVLLAAIDFGTLATGGLDAASTLVQQSYESMWTQALSGAVYSTVTTYASGIAAFTISVWTVQFYSAMSEGSPKPIAKNLVLAIFIAVMLANGGQAMASSTLGMRDIFRAGNRVVLKGFASGNDFSQKISELKAYSDYSAQAQKLAEECYALTDTARDTCYAQNKAKADALIASVNLPAEWAKSLGGGVNQLFTDPLKAVTTAATTSVNKVTYALQTPTMLVVEGLMFVMAGAFQHLVEVSMLTTAMLAPIALANSFLSPDKPAIIPWFAAMFGVAFTRFCLNIITGLTAEFAITAGPENGTLTPAITFGLLGPILAFALGSGGGMAVFGALTSVAQTSISFAIGKIK
jgi:hypothetical protein